MVHNDEIGYVRELRHNLDNDSLANTTKVARFLLSEKANLLSIHLNNCAHDNYYKYVCNCGEVEVGYGLDGQLEVRGDGITYCLD